MRCENHELDDIEIFYERDQCPLCYAYEKMKEVSTKLREEKDISKSLAHVLNQAPGPNRMDFLRQEWRDSQDYRIWYMETRESALKARREKLRS